MEIAKLQQEVKQFSRERGFESSTIEQRALYLVTEVGEMVRELLEISYHPEHEQLEDIKDRIGLEMYDIVWNICDLANKLDIDLETAFRKKIEYNQTRVW